MIYEQCEGCSAEVRFRREPADGIYLCGACRRIARRAARRAAKARTEAQARALTLAREPQAGERCGRCGGLLRLDVLGSVEHVDPRNADHPPVGTAI